MFCITIPIKGTQVVWSFLYQTKEAAEKQWAAVKGPANSSDYLLPLQIGDDFHQEAMIPREQIAAAMIEDLEQSKLAHAERALHNARTQAKAESMAAGDPVLKNAAMLRGRGPAVFNPVNGMGQP